jgi:hypothetical protein
LFVNEQFQGADYSERSWDIVEGNFFTSLWVITPAPGGGLLSKRVQANENERVEDPVFSSVKCEVQANAA